MNRPNAILVLEEADRPIDNKVWSISTTDTDILGWRVLPVDYMHFVSNGVHFVPTLDYIQETVNTREGYTLSETNNDDTMKRFRLQQKVFLGYANDNRVTYDHTHEVGAKLLFERFTK